MSHESKMELLHRKLAAAESPAGPAAVQRQHERGKLTARERVERLLDPDSVVELDAFAVHRTDAFGLQTNAT